MSDNKRNLPQTQTEKENRPKREEYERLHRRSNEGANDQLEFLIKQAQNKKSKEE